jgi:hypothetical protein
LGFYLIELNVVDDLEMTSSLLNFTDRIYLRFEAAG